MIEDWLNQNLYGYELLSEEEKEAIKHFSMLWSFFENYVLETRANANRIRHKMTEWENDGRLNVVPFLGHKQYFTDRYTENGTFNQRFQHLHLRRKDNPQIVRNVLLGNINDTSSVLTALLIIVLRFRNNFFHGLKWEDGLQDQFTNFNHSNEILIKIIELE